MKIYLLIVYFVVLTAANIGILLPYLISAASTELFLLGILDIIISTPVSFLVIKKIYKLITALPKEVENEKN